MIPPGSKPQITLYQGPSVYYQVIQETTLTTVSLTKYFLYSDKKLTNEVGYLVNQYTQYKDDNGTVNGAFYEANFILNEFGSLYYVSPEKATSKDQPYYVNKLIAGNDNFLNAKGFEVFITNENIHYLYFEETD